MAEPLQLSAFEKWRQRLGPELSRTAQRFPIPVVLIVIATILFLIEVNASPEIEGDILAKSVVTLAFSTLFAVACQLMVETGVLSKLLSWILAGIGLLVFGATLFFDSMAIGEPFMWAPILVLFMSVAPALKPRANSSSSQQDFFWWINHRSIVAACIAGLAFLLILLGMVIIERSVAVLFNIGVDRLIYGYLLTLAGVLFAPTYWLAMIPEVNQFDKGELEQPDPLSRAVGFLGLYIFTPFLCLYSLILMAYAAQILVLQAYPEGTVGWMVVGFICVAGLNHLLLYPGFMRAKPTVARYLRYWPFLAIIPLIMLVIAIQIRVSHYGLTPERILLIAGAVWTIAIIALGVFNKLDIRLLPGLAAFILLPISFGPFNIEMWAMRYQLSRFEQNYATWQDQQSDEAAQGLRSASNYLLNSAEGRQALTQTLTVKGMDVEGEITREQLTALLGVPDIAPTYRDNEFVLLAQKEPFDLSGDFIFYGRGELPCCEKEVGPYEFKLDDRELVITRENESFATHDLTPWLNQQNMSVTTLREPMIEIQAEGRTLLLLVYHATFELKPDEVRKPARLDYYVLEKKGNGAN